MASSGRTVRLPRRAPSTLFLLSPANLGGERARLLTSAQARFPAAARYRQGGLTIGEAFAWISSLYFRAKLHYARRFGSLATGSAVLVIAPGFGLVPEDWPLSSDRWRRLRRVPVDPRRPAFRRPLATACDELRQRLSADDRIVFLGGLSAERYLSVLGPALGPHLLIPRDFVSRGQMQRGSLLLRAIRDDEELVYASPP